MMNRRIALGALAATPLALRASPLAAAPPNTVTDAKPFAQTKDWSCWAAAAVILLRWKQAIPFSEADVAAMAGSKFKQAFDDDKGLKGSDFATFAANLGLRVEAPQSYTVAGYESLLKAHGPLWVAADVNSPGGARRHVRVLRGITGDGTFDGSTAWVLDPDGGNDYQVTVTAFAKEIEAIAKQELDAGSPLFPQVIRFP